MRRLVWTLLGVIGAVAVVLAVSASDSFTRANDSTGLGANWTCSSGADHFNVSSNTAISNPSATHNEVWCQYTNVTFSNDACSEGKMSGQTTVTVKPGPMVRWSGTSYFDATGYIFLVNSAGWELHSYASAENFTVLTSGSDQFANGDTAKICVSGSSLTVYKNGVSVGSTTDSTYTTGGIGIFAYDSVGGQATVDDWAGADFGGGGGGSFPSAIINVPVRGGGHALSVVK